jgi:hypothetical protein
MGKDILGRRSVAALIDLGVCSGLFLLVFSLFSHEAQIGRLTGRVISGWPTLFIPAIWLFYYRFATNNCGRPERSSKKKSDETLMTT